jgi:hypothetical protein
VDDRDWQQLPLPFKTLYEQYMAGTVAFKKSTIDYLHAQMLLEAKSLTQNSYFHDLLDILSQIQPLDG